jgi:hypothetical protein
MLSTLANDGRKSVELLQSEADMKKGVLGACFSTCTPEKSQYQDISSENLIDLQTPSSALSL